jgi:2-phosphosulfolactate phosphatase
MTTLEVLFAPAEFASLRQRDLSETSCVVFDVLRATTSMITALWNGAEAILPVEEISGALAARQGRPELLLAGERDGVRIGPELAGGIGFDLGNSPREFTPAAVQGKTVAMTTTNGTRALRACQQARTTLAASFLNLGATAAELQKGGADKLLIVCSGTFDQAAYEDALGAGALCDLVWSRYQAGLIADSARMAHELFLQSRGDLAGGIARSRNGCRLMSNRELRDDVAFCAQRDVYPLVAVLGKDGLVRRQVERTL